MAEIAIIGVGSPFGADNIGEIVIDELKSQLSSSEQVKLAYYDRPGIYLLECIKKFKTVHLVDAVLSQKPAGTLYRFESLSELNTSKSIFSSHSLGVAEVLMLGEAMGMLPQTLIIHGVEVNLKNSVDIISACKTLAYKIAHEIAAYVIGGTQ